MDNALTPDPDQIRRHLDVLFSALSPDAEYPDGLFELRFLTPGQGKPLCRLFGWSDLDRAVELILATNTKGANCYVGVHPRKPGTSGSGKAADVDRALWQFVDCDDGEASARLLDLPFPPNFVVETGTLPTQRLHGYFMLDVRLH